MLASTGEGEMKNRRTGQFTGVNLISSAKQGPAAAGRNYFTRHWQGQYPLLTSFWFNYIAVGLLFLLLLRIYPEMLLTSTLHALYIYIAVYCITLTVVIWQVVGLWRAADNHIRRAGKKFWAQTAKICAVLGLAWTAFMVQDLLPGLHSFAAILAKDVAVQKYSIRVMDNHKEVEITGGIKFGLTKSLRKVFNRYPEIKVIHLNSFGGRVVEARLLRQFIQEKKLITSTDKGCLSACTIAYMGGVSRYVYGERKLGFHRYGLTDNQRDLLKNAVVESFNEDKSFFLAQGTSLQFIRHIYNTAPSDLWFPEIQVLLKNRIITDIAKKNTFLLYRENTTDMHRI